MRIFISILGIYLSIHFFQIIPYADELFGNDQPFQPELLPSDHVFNIFRWVNASVVIYIMTILSILLTCQYQIRIVSFILWYAWSCTLTRNPFINNPGIPYVGWILLAISVMDTYKSRFNQNIYYLANLLMCLGYTVSGLHKLQSPSWIDGTALHHIISGPLGRPSFLLDFMLTLPPIILNIMTWGALATEILALPLGVFRHTRKWMFIIFIMFHLGIMSLVNFTDLTLGMIMIHLFTFEYRWLMDYFQVE